MASAQTARTAGVVHPAVAPPRLGIAETGDSDPGGGGGGVDTRPEDGLVVNNLIHFLADLILFPSLLVLGMCAGIDNVEKLGGYSPATVQQARDYATQIQEQTSAGLHTRIDRTD